MARPDVLECEIYAERDALQAEEYLKTYETRFGPGNAPYSAREVEMKRIIANMMHWVARDPDGFKQWCAKLKVKYGPLDLKPVERTDKQKESIAEVERLYDEAGDVGLVKAVGNE